MKLISVYSPDLGLGFALEKLYELLAARHPDESISHKKLPTMEEHVKFVLSHPYLAWYLIMDGWGGCRGAVYLTWKDEIGVHVFWRYLGVGVAVLELMRLHPRERYLAHINPLNKGTTELFVRMGFRHIQNTYEHRRGPIVTTK